MTVLCHAYERVAGEPFNALLKRRLLNPLGVCTASFSRALPSAL